MAQWYLIHSYHIYDPSDLFLQMQLLKSKSYKASLSTHYLLCN